VEILRKRRISVWCYPEIMVLRGIDRHRSLAFIGSASGETLRVQELARAEAVSITRLEGSRWRGGRQSAVTRIRANSSPA
jgi:hypothetical protein